MKQLLIMILVLGMSPVFADDPIRTQGRGPTFEEAKNEAFRSAIEIKVGSAIVSEQENFNDKVRDEIVNYSAGYVDKFEIVKQSQSGNGYYVIVDVWVSSSRIQNRILGISKNPKQFDGERIATQYQTYKYNKGNGDKLLNMILNDYPKRAYKVALGNHQLKVDVYRNAVIEIPIEIRWNPNYMISLNETLALLQDGSNGFLTRSPGNVVTMFKDPKDLVLGTKSHFKFNDVILTEKIRNTLVTREPRMLLEIKNFDNKTIFAECFTPDALTGKMAPFYNIGSDDFLLFYGNNVEKSKIQLVFDERSNNALQRGFTLDANIVTDEKCQI